MCLVSLLVYCASVSGSYFTRCVPSTLVVVCVGTRVFHAVRVCTCHLRTFPSVVLCTRSLYPCRFSLLVLPAFRVSLSRLSSLSCLCFSLSQSFSQILLLPYLSSTAASPPILPTPFPRPTHSLVPLPSLNLPKPMCPVCLVLFCVCASSITLLPLVLTSLYRVYDLSLHIEKQASKSHLEITRCHARIQFCEYFHSPLFSFVQEHQLRGECHVYMPFCVDATLNFDISNRSLCLPKRSRCHRTLRAEWGLAYVLNS